MKICVFGASGGVGQEVVKQALENGIVVRAVYRSPPSIPANKNLEIVIAPDILDQSLIKNVISDVDIIVSAIGLRRKHPANPWSRLVSPTDLTSRFSQLIAKVSKQINKMPRILAVSAGGVGDSWSNVSPPLKFLFSKSNIGVAYKDLNRMENIFKESGLDYVCIRPTTLTNSKLTKKIRSTDRYRFNSKISRADVAWYILANLKGSPLSRTPLIET
jgi:putative NADH-flavin reductase